MLMFGFAHEVIQNIKVEALRERMDNLVMQRLKGELSRCASCMVKCAVNNHFMKNIAEIRVDFPFLSRRVFYGKPSYLF